jgi:hypothetical protein
MAERTLITIERLTACGGQYIGQRLAERLQIPCYDREIVTGTAQLLRQEETALLGRDERRTSFWEKLLGAFSVGTPETEYAPPPFPMLEDTQLFSAEAEVIRQAAARGSGVFIGHGAAAVLQGEPGLFRVFCHAPREYRIQRLMKLYPNYNQQAAAVAVEQSDRQQQRYLKAVAGINWRDATAYDLTLNVATTGIDEAVAVILQTLRTRGEKE